MNTKLLTAGLCLLLSLECLAQRYKLQSPDKNITIEITAGDGLQWSARLGALQVIAPTAIALFANGQNLVGTKSKIIKKSTDKVEQSFEPAIGYKNAVVDDKFNQLSLALASGLSLDFRAYNDGVAYRFRTDLSDELLIDSEVINLSFPTGTTSLFPQEETLYSHYERTYLPTQLDTLSKGSFCSLPVLFDINGKAKVVMSESDLHDYPGLFLEANGAGQLNAKFQKYILETKPNEESSPDRNEIIVKEADYIAKTTGTRSFAWRTFVISDDDRELIASELNLKVASTSDTQDFSWVRPGRVAWDWYNANNIYGVDFKSGINTDTYKYYIDFASKYGIEYVILDEGWTKSTTEILESNPDIDIPALISYGQEKGVDLILWVLWKPLNENMTAILDRYQSWGAKGIKVDFMQRADQYMVNSYEQIAKACAERQLLVDYHGAFKPAGLRRMYPNVISYEGVKGNENNKWSADANPEHNVTLPFIRMVAGPMDYTPGAVRNANQGNFRISHFRPMSLGTRCHQVAMYAIYESPLQMYCDAPSAYLKEEETISFISQFPSSWEETRVLEAKVGDYVMIARRNGEKWYIGAMTDYTARELTVDLSFLGEGSYQLEIMQDGVNADMFAEDYKKSTIEATPATQLKIKLAGGGGWAAIVSKK